LEAPEVVQESFGQIQVRGDHNSVRCHLNGTIQSERFRVFNQLLSPRLISSMKLIIVALLVPPPCG
jgi:hypothetical protein